MGTQTRRMKKLEGSRSEFESLFNLIPDLVVIIDEKGEILAVNDSVEKFGFFKKKEVIGRNFLTTGILTAKSAQIVMGNLAKRMAGAQIPPYEVELTLRDGGRMWGEVNATKIEHQGRPANLAAFRDITERKRMEEELKRQQEEQQVMLDSVPVMIFYKDGENRLIRVNRAYAEAKGKPKEELEGKNMFELSPDLAEGYWRDDKEVIASGRSKIGIIEQMATAKGIRWIEADKIPYRDKKGDIIGVIGFAVDITERRQAEKAMKESELKSKTLLRHAIQLSVASGIEELVKSTLDAMEFTLGFNLAEFKLVEDGYLRVKGSRGGLVAIPEVPLDGPGVVVKAANIKKAVRVPDVRKEPAFVAPMMPSGEEADQILSELAVPVLVDGETAALLNVESTELNAFTDEDQLLLEILAMHVSSALARLRHVERLEDLVEERSRGLKESEETFRRICDASFDAIYTTTIEGEILDMNPAGVSMLGYESPEEVRKTSIEPFYLDLDDRRRLIDLVQKGPVRGFETRFKRKDGAIIDVAINIYPLTDQSGRIVRLQGAFTDITERRRMEKQLLEAERLATIGMAAAMVGHDLRNPLQAIVNTTHLARRELEDTEMEYVEKRLEAIQEQTWYMNKIVADLQDYSSPLQPQLAETSIPQLISDAISGMVIPENVRVSVDVEDRMKLMVDASMIRRLFANLMLNAIQAMPEGGQLTIKASKNGEEALVSFHDTGVGVPEENLDRLFSPFFTTRAKGLGLGLAVCKRLAEAHGGTVSVESKAGEGSTFTVHLPRHQQKKPETS